MLTATLYSAVDGAPPYKLTVGVFENGMARVKLLEDSSLPARWEASIFVARVYDRQARRA